VGEQVLQRRGGSHERYFRLSEVPGIPDPARAFGKSISMSLRA
jgi:hypothetical protein